MIDNSNLNKVLENIDTELSPFSSSSGKDDEMSFKMTS
jgi:hypothetical protein